MFFLGKLSTDIDVDSSFKLLFSVNVLRRTQLNGAPRMRRYRRRRAAVQKVLEALNVPGANEDGIGSSLFRSP
jgi:hypothetical protein